MSAPDRYAVIGHPIAHSRSPQIHALFAQDTGQSLRYDAFDVPPAELHAWVRAFFEGGGRGLNVTVPHKQAVLALCARLSERARSAGAANTLVLDGDGQLLGDNTDGVGLVRDLTQNLRIALRGRRLLLLGAGGAARGVIGPLLALEPTELVIANRTAERAQELVALFAGRGPIRAESFAVTGRFDVLINATAASLHGQALPLPASAVDADTACYDMAYGHGETPFVKWAHAHGVRQAYMGFGMLLEQAAESFELWRGVRPDTAAVRKALVM